MTIPLAISTRWSSTLENVKIFLVLDKEWLSRRLEDASHSSLKQFIREYIQLK